MVVRNRTTKRDWEWGDRAALAKLSGISAQYLNDILRGRRWPGHLLASRLERMSRRMGYEITVAEWALPCARREGKNPLFRKGGRR
jgi:transcriptional regulator with XRE-family HTH domain